MGRVLRAKENFTREGVGTDLVHWGKAGTDVPKKQWQHTKSKLQRTPGHSPYRKQRAGTMAFL